MRRSRTLLLAPLLLSLASLASFAGRVPAQDPQLVTLDPLGGSAFGDSTGPLLSQDGRYVAFTSTASDLVFGDENDASDVYVRDLLTGALELVSRSSADVIGNEKSELTDLSPDGRYVVFDSDAKNLVPNGKAGVYVRDRLTGQTTQESVAAGGIGAGGFSGQISDDGRFVAFSSGTNIVPGAGNSGYDVFVRDRQTGVTEIVTLGPGGVPASGPGDNYCYVGSPHGISGDGRWVVFATTATNLDPDHVIPAPPFTHVYAHDRATGQTQLLDVNAQGVVGQQSSYAPGISGDGRYAAFLVSSPQLMVPDNNGWEEDLFIRDLQTGELTRANVGTLGQQANAAVWNIHGISGDGRYVCFDTAASNLVATDTVPLGDVDVYVHDRVTGLTRLVSVDAAGSSPASPCRGGAISADGTAVAFETAAALVPADDNGSLTDVYFTHVDAGSPWTDLGGGLAGGQGVPVLDADGPLTSPSSLHVALGNYAPGGGAVLVIGLSAANLPLKGGTLVPAPMSLLSIPALPPHHLVLTGHVAPGLPAGVQLHLQYWLPDPAGPQGFAASNAMRGTTP
jgi:Tol biopolymer transport system component